MHGLSSIDCRDDGKAYMHARTKVLLIRITYRQKNTQAIICAEGSELTRLCISRQLPSSLSRKKEHMEHKVVRVLVSRLVVAKRADSTARHDTIRLSTVSLFTCEVCRVILWVGVLTQARHADLLARTRPTLFDSIGSR